ncbi:unnamed protein product [Paramecium primaurelia]|uniref:Uncharacterized protein n=1 Tax=Paramecium primaurelia TaxID=5886 RepID=A0A8S1M5N7_PARPR|nr:unnamed protein product [Paramecium primaurelia]
MQLKSITSEKQANKTTGLGSSRTDYQRLNTAKLKSLESIISDKNNKQVLQPLGRKDQIKMLQDYLQEKINEYSQVEKKIELYKKEGDQMNDYVEDLIKEYCLQLVRQGKKENTTDDQIKLLQEKKQQLKQETIQLHNLNKVQYFELEVQQGLSLKLNAQKQQLKRKIQLFDEYYKKTEQKIRQKQPNLDFNEMPKAQRNKQKPNAVAIIQKTPDEILQEKTMLIDEYTKKIEQLTFQIQEITRTCILEKQELIKKIQDTKEEQLKLSDKILNLRLRLNKFDKLEQSLSSDKCISDIKSNDTEHSQQQQQELII